MKIINASPKLGRPLSEEQIMEFLINSKIVHLGTVDNKGRPNIHPSWYYFDQSIEKFYINTPKNSAKTNNLRENRNIYFCIDDPNPPYKGVKGIGICIVHDDIDTMLPITEKLMTRYLGTINHPMAQATLSFTKNGDRVILEISPKYYSTWDYS